MSRKTKTFFGIMIGAIVCLTFGGLSGFVTREAIPTWYVGLNKPLFTPPNSIFGPVWTTLYVLMGGAAGWIWSFGSHHRWVKTALYHFVAQLVVNALWSSVFFGLRNPGMGLLVILLLLFLIQRTIHWFSIIHKPAAYLLYPYMAWVAFASVLNLAIFYLN